MNWASLQCSSVSTWKLPPCMSFNPHRPQQQQEQQRGGSMWPYLLQRRRFIYSSDISHVNPLQLSELWEKTLKVQRQPEKIAIALKHSFAILVVLEQQDGLETSSRKTIGFGRAVSDGAFIATICDVAVDPNYQKRGIGRRIVKELVQNMKRRGGPTGFAVFPTPITRRFFWRLGFRSEKKYRFMLYRGRLLKDARE